MGFFIRLLERPYNMAAGFLRVGDSRKSKMEATYLLYPGLEKQTLLFLQYPVGYMGHSH